MSKEHQIYKINFGFMNPSSYVFLCKRNLLGNIINRNDIIGANVFR
jgi:hypothetical protein